MVVTDSRCHRGGGDLFDLCTCVCVQLTGISHRRSTKWSRRGERQTQERNIAVPRRTCNFASRSSIVGQQVYRFFYSLRRSIEARNRSIDRSCLRLHYYRLKAISSDRSIPHRIAKSQIYFCTARSFVTINYVIGKTISSVLSIRGRLCETLKKTQCRAGGYLHSETSTPGDDGTRTISHEKQSLSALQNINYNILFQKMIAGRN